VFERSYVKSMAEKYVPVRQKEVGFDVRQRLRFVDYLELCIPGRNVLILLYYIITVRSALLRSNNDVTTESMF
jgi:hypothetical protein